MKTLRNGMLAMVVALLGSLLPHVVQGQSPEKARERLIGVWRLVSIDEPGAGGTMLHHADLKGMLVYTRDGRVSVQVMYPKSEAAQTNDYVQSGYEASFGSFDVNEATHTVTHHVEGSLTRGLIGRDLPRVFQFVDGHLTIRSSNPVEHWVVTWERY